MPSNTFNFLFVGDIIGKPGRKVAKHFIPIIKEEFDIDFVIANGENLAAGYGITEKIKNEMIKGGVNIFTSGNHIWDKKEGVDLLRTSSEILRPANYSDDLPGYGYIVKSIDNGLNFSIINLQGRVFMTPIDSPFNKVDSILKEISERTNIVIVDFHAEATSEKKAMGWYLDGRVSAVIGTHTHIQTADEEILPGGTAYITDAGMCGGFDSVIGMKKEAAIYRMLYGVNKRLEPSNNDLRFNGVVVSIDKETGRAVNIIRINRKMEDGNENT